MTLQQQQQQPAASNAIMTTTMTPATTAAAAAEVNATPPQSDSNVEATILLLDRLVERIHVMKNEVQALRAFVSEVLGNDNVGHRLLLIRLPTSSDATMDPMAVVKSFVADQLKLSKISEKVRVAQRLANGNIAFEAGSTLDKKMILLKAKRLSKEASGPLVVDVTLARD